MNATAHTDGSFPYVLIYSTVSTIVGLGAVWISTAVNYAPMLVA